MKAFKKWLSGFKQYHADEEKPSYDDGISIPVLWGADEEIYDGENDGDLVALAPVDSDPLNLFIRSKFGFLLRVRPQALFETHMHSKT